MNLNMTPTFSAANLCGTCRWAHTVKGVRFKDDATYCRALQQNPRMGDVRHCSQYDDRRVPSVVDMEHIAWQLVTDSTRGRIGFISAQEFRDREQRSYPVPRG